MDVAALVPNTAEQWIAVGTVGTMLVAIVAAIVALRQVAEARHLREDQTRPYVVVDVESSPAGLQVLNLVIANAGQTLARNVKLNFEPELRSSEEGYVLHETVLMREGIKTMPPGRRIEVWFDRAFKRDKTGLPMRYDVTVEYDDARGQRQEPLRYVLDLAHLYGPLYIGVKGVHDIVKALEDVRDYLKASRDGSVLAFSVSDRDLERERRRSEHAITGRWPRRGRKPPPDWMVYLGLHPVRRLVIGWIARLIGDIRSVAAQKQGRAEHGGGTARGR